MIEQDSDYALLTEIAVAYYDQEQTQEEIAKRFGISRIKVGRLLKKARQEGIVEISVKYHPVFSSQIEQQFISHFGIKRALIALDHHDEDEQRQQVRDRGDDPDELAKTYARVLNKALEGKPDDLTIGLHVCRGNFRSTWISEGGYEPVAEVLFGTVNVDAFFLEYDNDRSGDFAPLRFVRPGKQQVVLGLITTKHGELENPEGVKARLEEAARYVAKEQICLSPQCGFASTEEGNSLSEAQQWDKVRLVTQIASDVW